MPEASYLRRKQAGQCVQCGAPADGPTIYCLTHKQINNKAGTLRRQRKRPLRTCIVAGCSQTIEQGRRYRRCVTHQKIHHRERKKKQKRDRQRRMQANTPFEYFFWSRSRKIRGVYWRDLMALWQRQQYCPYTREPLAIGPLVHLDHIIPKTRGGKTTIDNLQWVTGLVNRMKTDLTHDEFVAICRQVVSNHPL